MDSRTQRGATALALFSLALGSAQVGAPGAVARLVGADDDPTTRAVTRWACGVREIVAGFGVGSAARPAGWLWARVAGDVVDLALLGAVLHRHRARDRRVRALGATAAVLGVTAADVLTAVRASARPAPDQLDLYASTTVRAPVGEVYRFWRDVTNLPRFMAHLQRVEVLGDGSTRWTARGAAGAPVTWESEISADVPGELLAWRSLPGASVPNSGTARFSPAPGGGTEVTLQMHYRPAGGRPGTIVAALVGGSPEQQVRDDLRRFAQVLESGEVSGDATPS